MNGEDINKNWISSTKRGDVLEMKTHLEAGADIDFKDEFGQTALMRAVIENRPEVVSFLLENKADHLVENNGGETVLHIALYWGCSTDCVKMLLDASPKDQANTKKIQNVFSDMIDRFTSFDTSHSPEDSVALILLIEHGANVTAKSSSGKTYAQVIFDYSDMFSPDLVALAQAKIDKKAISAQMPKSALPASKSKF